MHKTEFRRLECQRRKYLYISTYICISTEGVSYMVSFAIMPYVDSDSSALLYILTEARYNNFSEVRNIIWKLLIYYHS